MKNEVSEQRSLLPARGRVIDMRPNYDEAIKPSELIQISGHQNLTLNARRAITILWHNAHRQGVEEGKDYVIELAELRTDKNRALGHVREAIHSLMKTLLIVRLPGGKERAVQFLGGNDMDDPERPAGTFTYSFDKRLIELLQSSAIWGKIALPVLMAFSSKYAVSLYENACQWSGLQHKIIQDFTLDELRVLMGVEDGKYQAFGDLNIHVLRPAVMEINALAPFNISVVPIKSGRSVMAVKIGWWRKSSEELQAAFHEAQQPKVGRRARLSGRVENVFETSKSPSSLARDQRKLAARANEKLDL